MQDVGADDLGCPCCCRLRDEVLPLLGVLLQDKADDTSEWVLEDPTVLATEAEQKRRCVLSNCTCWLE